MGMKKQQTGSRPEAGQTTQSPGVAAVTGAPAIRIEAAATGGLAVRPEEFPVEPGDQVVWLLEQVQADCVIEFQGRSPLQSAAGDGGDAPAAELRPEPDGRIRATVDLSAARGGYPYRVRVESDPAITPAEGRLVVTVADTTPVVVGPSGAVN